MKKSKQPIIWGIIIVFIVVLLSWNRIFPSKEQAIVSPENLPGVQTNAGAWDPATATLLNRLKAVNLPALAQEGSALHIHQHVDLYINGTATAIPSDIGISRAGGFISPLHTHDLSGIVHVESNTVREFSLGEFFDVWGVLFTNECIGGYCTDGANTLKVYSNGTLITGDLRSHVLTPHEEIVIVYGTSSPASIPSTYTFPAGY